MYNLNAKAIFIHQNRVLIVREKYRKLFSLPGGGIKTGETIEDGLIRELKEELGIDITKASLIFAKMFLGPANRKSRVKAYCYFIKETQFSFPPPSSIEEMVWIDPENTSEYNLTWILKNEIIPYIKDRIKDNTV